MEFIRLGRTGEKMPVLGLGTFGMGGRFSPDHSKDKEWRNALKKGIEMGYTLIDTAEIYGGGHAEELVGEAIKGFDRDELFIVSKVSPENEGRKVVEAAEKSAKRLGTHIDLYLIHMPVKDLEGTMKGMEKLVERGLVRHMGVSNFGIELTKKAMELGEVVANQSELSMTYTNNLPLLEWCKKNSITFMAYSPLGQGDLFKHKNYARIKAISRKYGKTAAQTALKWVINKGAVALVKSDDEKHLRENMKIF